VQPEELPSWAEQQAAALLAGLGDRWTHVQAVAAKAHQVSVVLGPEDRPYLIAAAWLHDVGYAPPLNRLGFHPVDGARYVRQQGQERLASLVAYPSGAVAGVEAVPVQWRGVADVMQPGGGDQVGAILGCERGAHLAGLSGDGLDMAPAVAETREEPGGQLLGPGGKLGGLHTADPIRR